VDADHGKPGVDGFRSNSTESEGVEDADFSSQLLCLGLARLLDLLVPTDNTLGWRTANQESAGVLT